MRSSSRDSENQLNQANQANQAKCEMPNIQKQFGFGHPLNYLCKTFNRNMTAGAIRCPLHKNVHIHIGTVGQRGRGAEGQGQH